MESASIRWLYGLQHFGIKLGLENIRTLLASLGRPDRTFPSILVAGTNGKGSVAAMLDAVLGAHGLRTGLYTSPHLVRPNERIRIAGGDIAAADLDRLLDRLRETIETAVRSGALETHPSFFEVMTAVALVALEERHTEAAVLEVGMGGRLDATNAVDAALSVVVTVDLDHTERLGSSLAGIAAEKAAIAKPDRTLVSGVAQEEARGVLRRVCRQVGARLLEAREVARIEPEADGCFGVATARARYGGLRLSLPGEHQKENARVALVAAEAFLEPLGRDLDPESVRAALATVRWPGRLHWIDGTPPLLLDGAHNPSGAAALAGWLEAHGGPKPVLVFAAMRDKDAAGILAPLGARVSAILLTRPSVGRAAEPETLVAAASAAATRIEVVSQPAEAVRRARELAGPAGLVLVAGSLYLVGDVLTLLEGADGPGPVAT
jgi:dihydrofolate synthase / folylpolyglutamate synthase